MRNWTAYLVGSADSASLRSCFLLFLESYNSVRRGSRDVIRKTSGAMDKRLRAILDDPVAVLYGSSVAADELVGDRAVDLVASALRDGWESPAHPVDVIEALQYLLSRIAVHNYAEVEELLHDDSLQSNREVVRGALEWALGK